jgi:hypothetical protein
MLAQINLGEEQILDHSLSGQVDRRPLKLDLKIGLGHFMAGTMPVVGPERRADPNVGLKAQGESRIGASSELGIFPREAAVMVQQFGTAMKPWSRNRMWY